MYEILPGPIRELVLGFGMGNFNDVTMEQLADNGDGSYTLSHMIRGGRGTDVFAAGHSDNELCVWLEEASLRLDTIALGDRLFGFPHLVLAVVVLFFSLGPKDIGEDVNEYCNALESGDEEIQVRVTGDRAVQAEQADGSFVDDETVDPEFIIDNAVDTITVVGSDGAADTLIASSATGSNSIRVTRPIVTPDIETGARGRRLPTLSKRAVISKVLSAEKSSPPVV